VIHAGIYYPAGSLKARLCVAGRRQLYAYCAERGIAHRRCGKLIVATGEASVDELDAIAARARANGVDDLQHGCRATPRAPWSRRWNARRPALAIDRHHRQPCPDALAAGRRRARRRGAGAAKPPRRRVEADGMVLDVAGNGDGIAAASCWPRSVVNCAGLGAQALPAH
jgi:hypothetical protein